MRRTIWMWIFASFLVFGLFAFGCDTGGDDDDDDGGDDGGDIPDVPDDVNDFLDQEDIDKLEDAGMTIHTGDNPPNVEGTYDLNSLVITYDEIGMEGWPIDYYWIKYYDQTDDGEIKLDYEGAGGTDVGDGLGAFISGDGKCFTVYIDTKGNASGCDYEMPSLHSGCLETTGIKDFQWGFIMKKKSGENCDYLMPEGAARIVDETDGMASKQ